MNTKYTVTFNDSNNTFSVEQREEGIKELPKTIREYLHTRNISKSLKYSTTKMLELATLILGIYHIDFDQDILKNYINHYYKCANSSNLDVNYIEPILVGMNEKYLDSDKLDQLVSPWYAE